MTAVDAGGGWLIFGLPPAEVGFHPIGPEEAVPPELYLMCDDLDATITRLRGKGVETDPVTQQRWGLVTRVTMPSGARLGIYQPRHARPAP